MKILTQFNRACPKGHHAHVTGVPFCGNASAVVHRVGVGRQKFLGKVIGAFWFSGAMRNVARRSARTKGGEQRKKVLYPYPEGVFRTRMLVR